MKINSKQLKEMVLHVLSESSNDYRKMKELWYVKKSDGSVKNISTSKEKADDFLWKSLKGDGDVYYVEVPLEDWNQERVNTSNITKYAKELYRESEYHSPSDYEGKWYEDMEGTQFLHKYPQDFIDWLDKEDTWAMTYAHKYRINKIIELFDLWVNETY